MATWPAYAKFVMAGVGEPFEPSVERTEMERSVPKQRIINTSVLAQFGGTVLFQSAADAASFETWYFTTISRIGYFDFVHPRTGATIQARFVGGALGSLVPMSAKWRCATREAVLEYLR